MKHTVIRFSMIALLIGSVALTAAQVNAQRFERFIQFNSLSFGITPGQTARVSVVQFAFADGSVRTIRARIQLLDTEGEVVAQSDEIRVERGKTRFWDAPYEQIGGVREPTGRLQLRARMLVETNAGSQSPQLAPTLEVFDSSTGGSLNRASLFLVTVNSNGSG